MIYKVDVKERHPLATFGEFTEWLEKQGIDADFTRRIDLHFGETQTIPGLDYSVALPDCAQVWQFARDRNGKKFICQKHRDAVMVEPFWVALDTDNHPLPKASLRMAQKFANLEAAENPPAGEGRMGVNMEESS